MERPTAERHYRLGEALVEPLRNRITIGRTSERVTKREMDVLMRLIQGGSSVVPRETFLDDVWTDVVVNDDALTLAVSRLRRALNDDPRQPRFIETIPTRGYRLLVDVEIGADVQMRSRGRQARTSRIAAGVALVLLALMTILFLTARSAYKDLSSSTPSDSPETVAGTQNPAPRAPAP